ncbi:TIM barrel protein [Kordiimonas pumila]|uniref:TIM barrel protein n=1 Tax=Kordiimonas pumila TaxID=2161677 RepID=A0ABV7D626_9PROT|nr:TIM barrel protein [Kordiimonas pumila]
MMFTEYAFWDRFNACAKAGFRNVELQFHGDFSGVDVAAVLKGSGCTLVLFNANVVIDSVAGFGFALEPEKQFLFQKSIEDAAAFAGMVGCKKIHVLSGEYEGVIDKKTYEVWVHNMKWAAQFFRPHEIMLMIEPLNGVDRPHYVLKTLRQAYKLLRDIDEENVGLQLDLYHAAKGGDWDAVFVSSILPYIQHIQIAGVPARNEPDRGSPDTLSKLEWLFSVGYNSYIGCEYMPYQNTIGGLGWAVPYGLKAKT